MDKDSFREAMVILFKHFPNLSPDKEQQRMWKALLSDLEPDQLVGAVLSICRDRQEIYPNTNIVALIRDYANKFNGPGLSAEEGWGQVIGQYNGSKPNVSEITKQAVELMGGWHYIGMTQEKDLGVMRAHFYRAFEALQRREKVQVENTQIDNLLSHLGEAKSFPKISDGGYLKNPDKFNEDSNKIK
jgi:hypothetical protein